MSVDQTWLDRNAAWSAMLDRTDVHLRSLRDQVEQKQAANPYEVAAEPTGTPDRVAYRGACQASSPGRDQHHHRVYNLRPALDSLAYEMAVRHIGRPLKDPPTGAALSQNGNDERSRLRIPLGPRTRSAP